MRDRVVRFADRTLAEDLLRDRGEHTKEWNELTPPRISRPLDAIAERMVQIQPRPAGSPAP